MARKRLLWHLFIPYLVITIIALLVGAWVVSEALGNFYFKQVDRDLEIRGRLIERNIFESLQAKDYTKIDKICKELKDTSLARLTIILPSGEVAGDSDHDTKTMEKHNNRPEVIEAFGGKIGASTRFSGTISKNMRYIALPIMQDNQVIAVLRVSVPLTSIEEQLSKIYHKIFIGSLIVIFIVAMITLLISKRLSRPIEKMREAANHYAIGDFGTKVKLSKCLELAELALSLNTMRHQLQERIATITKQRNESEAVLSSMAEGVVAVDNDGRIVSVNKAAGELLGIDIKNSQGKGIEEIIRYSELIRFIREIIETAEPSEVEITLAINGGKNFQIHGTGLSDESGNRNGAVVVLNDITRTHRLENVRKDFVANVSHELKTPVTSIKGFVETLLDGAVTDAEQAKKFLNIIARQSDRLNAIIEDLLTLSRLEDDGQRDEISFAKQKIRPILEAAVELSAVKAREKQIELTLDCETYLECRLNAALFEQAIVNLIDNAVKFSDAGKTIQIGAKKQADEIVIFVKDSGCGIEQKHLARIFERFYVVDKSRSRKLGGTGLGLSIVKHITQVHGGTVHVQSTVGVGSIFEIYLAN